MITQDGGKYGRGIYQYSASVTVSPMVDSSEKLVHKEGFAFITWVHHFQNKNATDCVQVVTVSALCDYWINKDGALQVGGATLHRVQECKLYRDGDSKMLANFGTTRICKAYITELYYGSYCDISQQIIEAVIRETELARLAVGLRVAMECELDVKP